MCRCLSILLAVLLWPGAIGAVEMLSGQEIEGLVIGKSRSGELSHGTRYCEYYDPNGQIRGYDDEYYTGQWATSGSRLCYDYAGDEYDNCEALAISGNHIQAFAEDGSLSGLSKLRLGNVCASF